MANVENLRGILSPSCVSTGITWSLLVFNIAKRGLYYTERQTAVQCSGGGAFSDCGFGMGQAKNR